MSDPAARIPNLFIVGAPKCGTTAWVEYLRTHPDIYISTRKEQCYFAHDLPNFRLTRTAEDYAELFRGSAGARYIGEASVMYLFSNAAARAIRDHNPDARILIFIRDQETFLPSLHNQFLWEFAEEIEDFEQAWRMSESRPPEKIPAGCLEPTTLDYASMGRFDEQVARYLECFPPDQVRVIRFEDWVANPRESYVEILDFLDVPDDGRTEFEPINQGMTFGSRRAARLVVAPPAWLRRLVQSARKVAGPLVGLAERLAWKAVISSAKRGYRRNLPDELREEIRGYYAEPNRRLQERLENCGCVRSASTSRT